MTYLERVAEEQRRALAFCQATFEVLKKEAETGHPILANTMIHMADEALKKIKEASSG